MLNEMDKVYEPKKFADKIYQDWQKSGYFNPDNLNLSDDALSYTITLPPPNITDKLHLGHSVMIAIEDLLIRYHRQKGFRALWVPGTDHAAIATQNVVEKKLLKEKGLTKHDLGKEKFLVEINNYVKNTQAVILEQMKKMGASLDWSRLAFTLDDKRQKAVQQMFIEMYNEGLIYKGERIVNWCPRCQSTLADDEIDYQEQNAKLYTFYYHKDLPIAISTTRPETKLGDTAIAVLAKDKRYSQFLNQVIDVNFLGINLKLKIIDSHMVDSDFGSGALGVTPAHSMVDWQMAKDHNLEIKKVINEEAKIREGFGDFSGLSTLAAREKIVQSLKDRGLLIKEEEIVNNISTCYRCGQIIEPLLSKQWFVAVDKKIERLKGRSLKEAALNVVKRKQIEFIPERFNDTYFNWMNNLHDWCISRQIWFGHSIPAWYKGEEIYVGLNKPPGEAWQKDTDTLDTWFSSSMWTFSTLGWPEKSLDLSKYHPTDVLNTGYEILSLWVSRMIMMSLFALQEIPFKQVYLHGLILDEQGKKMSKSKGNGVDPLDLIDKYGADAIRLALLSGSTPGNDSRFNEEKIIAKRNFINKFWNISRYIVSQVDLQESSLLKENNYQKINFQINTQADYWIVNKLLLLNKKIESRISEYEFSLAIEDLIQYIWHDLADWYLEIAKIEGNKEGILNYILVNVLRLIHPFIPFASESIWQSLMPGHLIVEKYPDKIERDLLQDLLNKYSANNQVENFSLIQKIVVGIREARSSHRIAPSEKIKASIYSPSYENFLKNNLDLIKGLKTNLSEIEILNSPVTKIEGKIFINILECEIYLSVNIDKDRELKRLRKEKENFEKIINNLQKKLALPSFIEKAPIELVKQEKEKLTKWQLELAKINDKIKEYDS
jgi:valyl-tRNA synthetase